MPTPATENGRSVATAVKDVADHAKRVVSLELELAKLELTRKVASLGIGIGLGIAAAVCALYAVGFGLAAGAAGLATAVPTWLALLIVMAVLLLLTGILGLLAVSRIKKGTPPVPEQAIEEAKLTTEALKSDA
jgi:Putative Actinobacterial Holin-X, holin superfamily III